MVGQKSSDAGEGIQGQGRKVHQMSKTATHYLPDGKVYTGPMHKEGGVLMTGAKHTPASKVLSHTPPKKVKK